MSGSVSNETLLYSWGNAQEGKLGLGHNYYTDLSENGGHTQIFIDDQPDATVRGQKTDQLLSNNKNEDPEQAEHEVEFDSKYVFTPVPQPVVSLLGVKMNKVAMGQNHVLALSSDLHCYSWGSNSQGQLGMSKAQTL